MQSLSSLPAAPRDAPPSFLPCGFKCSFPPPCPPCQARHKDSDQPPPQCAEASPPGGEERPPEPPAGRDDDGWLQTLGRGDSSGCSDVVAAGWKLDCLPTTPTPPGFLAESGLGERPRNREWSRRGSLQSGPGRAFQSGVPHSRLRCWLNYSYLLRQQKDFASLPHLEDTSPFPLLRGGIAKASAHTHSAPQITRVCHPGRKLPRLRLVNGGLDLWTSLPYGRILEYSEARAVAPPTERGSSGGASFEPQLLPRSLSFT